MRQCGAAGMGLLVVVLLSGRAFAVPIVWCVQDPGPCSGGVCRGVKWGCDCEGKNCAPLPAAQIGALPCCLVGCPVVDATLTVSETECVGQTCSVANLSCADSSDPCDESTCASSGTPRFVPGPGGAGTVVNLPVCVHRRSCGSSAGFKELPSDVCRPLGLGRNGGDTEVGDPIDVDSRLSTHAHVDLMLPTPSGPFQLTRTYTAADAFWKREGGRGPLLAPFGPSVSSSDTMNWSHTLVSFAERLPNSTCTVRVRRGDGSLLHFTGCQSAPAFLTPGDAALEIGAQLQLTTAGYVLYDGNRRYEYGDSNGVVLGTDYRVLTAIRDGQLNASRPPIVELRYTSAPGGCSQPAISSATVGGQFELEFIYEPLRSGSDCALSQILHGADSLAF